MSGQHTPGPWKLVRWYDGKISVAETQDQNRHPYLAEVSGPNFWPEQEANARLIAAAPELLGALQHLFNSYKSLADSGDAGNWRLEDQPEGIKALAAINKATASTTDAGVTG